MNTFTRRGFLLAAVRNAPGPVTTQWAENVLAASPYSCHRNSARKTLRSLVAEGELLALEENGRRTYVRPPAEERSAA
ncbi:hypothetical protein ACFQ7O_23940 [Streptomyces sp. NPDC056485]|uniref:hypothetical protein n=1 Tax=Streptomyces sp. NPDC056485 TaxID=3345834 RepID=UPI0036B63455